MGKYIRFCDTALPWLLHLPSQPLMTLSPPLEKRFLKKPKILEASHEFEQLAKKLDEEKIYDYSAYTYLAKARCENLMGNVPSNEVQSLIMSGRQYIKELEHQVDGGKILNQDEIIASSINSYSHAIKILVDQKNFVTAGNVCLEIGDILMRFGKYSESWIYYLKAAEYLANIPYLFILSLQCMTSCKLKEYEYGNAFTVIDDLIEFCEDYIRDYDPGKISHINFLIKQCCITRILLLMIIQPSTKNSKQISILEDVYSSENAFSGHEMPETFSIIFKSFIAWDEKDLQSLNMSHNDLSNFLDLEQQTLADRIIDIGFHQNT
ncbi:unnamed protein product [Gordionus sp. m RMFG-2023]